LKQIKLLFILNQTIFATFPTAVGKEQGEQQRTKEVDISKINQINKYKLEINKRDSKS
jgi:hypothetical protein